MIPSLFVGEVLEVDPLSKGGSFHSLRRGGWMGSYRSLFNPFLIPYIPFWGEDDPLTFIELCFIPAPLHLICLLDWAWLCPEYLSTLSIFCNLHLIKHHFFCSIAFIWELLYILSTFAPDNNALLTLDQNLSALRIFCTWWDAISFSAQSIIKLFFFLLSYWLKRSLPTIYNLDCNF